MRHLNDGEFVDLIDGALGPARVRHAESCRACRARAEQLRSMLAEAASDAAPEPSPLFWDHFAARVSTAIRQEPAFAPAGPAWLEWLRHPVSMWAGLAAVTILMIATVVWRATLHAPAPPPAVAEQATSTPPIDLHDDPAVSDDADADEAWAIVRTAADDLEWDDADAAGITARPGSAERVMLELTAAERAELVRILESEMKRSGA